MRISIYAVILCIFSILSIDIAVRTFFTKSSNRRLFYKFRVLAFGTGILCLGQSLMLVMEDQSLYLASRALMFMGLFIYLISAQSVLVTIARRREQLFNTIILVETVLAITIFFLAIAPDSVVIKENGQTINAGFGYTYLSVLFWGFIAAAVIIFLLIAVSMMLKGNNKRNRVLGRYFLLIELLIMAGFISDNLILSAGSASNITISAMLMFLGMCISYYAVVKLNRNLISSDNMTSYMLSTVKSPILIFNEDDRITLVNDEAEKFFNISNLELFNRRNFWGEIVKPDPDRAITESSGTVIVDVDYTNGSNNHKLRIHMDKIYDEYQEYLGYIAMVEDVSLISGYMEEIKQAKLEADKYSAAKSRFLANMSHEIRTPMNSILGFSELALKMDFDPKTKEFFGDIHDSAENLLAIINDVLDIAKVDSGDIELSEEEYSSESFFKELTELIRPRAEAKGLKYRLDIDSDFPRMLYGDRIKLKQSLFNLLINSVKYTNKGQVDFKILYAPIIGMNEGRATFIIKDTGQGIKEEDKEEIFSKFQRVDAMANSKTEGTGLGLSISKAYVELLGGSISMESTYGVGTTMTIELPLKVTDASPMHKAEVPSDSADNKAEAKAIPINELHILAVDDSATNLKVLRLNMKKRFGVDIKTASSGADAIELCRFNDFDLIFMDHMMPEMDGVEAMKFIRMLGRGYEGGGRRKIVVLTANVVGDAKEMLLHEGFDGFIGKPVDYQELEDTVRHLFFKE